ncbi:MAG: hypothetical protein HOO91_14310 [Bacteroidales bacterium]|nr:hypothetical protein [Bacteroidales bacterium]
MGRLLKLLALIARFGLKIGKRIFELEELAASLASKLRVLMRLADYEKDSVRATRLLVKAMEVEEKMKEAARKAARLRAGLGE